MNELATSIMSSGVNLNPAVWTIPEHELLTEYFMQHQINTENYYIGAANVYNRDTLIICDRGTMDSAAYINKESFDKVCKKMGWSREFLTSERYDLVLHMVTAADGAEEFYTTANNAQRRETVDEAKQMDKNTQQVWIDHFNLKVVDNQGDGFDAKLSKVFNLVSTHLDYHPSIHLTKKYILPNGFDLSRLPKNINYTEYLEHTDYLTTEDPADLYFVKRRISKEGVTFYSYNERHYAKDISQRRETKRIVNSNNYESFLRQKDANKHTLSKRLTVFIWNNAPFIIDEYYDHETEKVVTFIRYEEFLDSNIPLPTFIEIGDDISDVREYHVMHLAENARNPIDFR